MLINIYCYCVRNITLFPEESDHACSHGHATIGGGVGACLGLVTMIMKIMDLNQFTP